MENLDQIIELLEQDEISEEEKKYLSELKEKDPEAAKLIDTYHKIKNISENSLHLDEEIIADYILFLNGEKQRNRYLTRFITKIDQHLSKCSKCRSVFDELQSEFREVDEFMSNFKGEESDGENNKFSFTQKPVFKYAAASIFILIMIYGALFALTTNTLPEYKSITSIQMEDFENGKRGIESENFQQGMAALQRGNYNSAIDFLTNDIKENGIKETEFYSHYILGLLYLKNSESDFLGLFKDFDKEKVDKAIHHLNLAIDKNEKPEFKNILYDSYFYLGKAFALIDKKEKAKDYFTKVIENKGSYTRKASEILNELDS